MKIGLFYSYGPHFLQALKYLRERYPDDALEVFVPDKFPEYYTKGIADKVIYLPWDGKRLGFLSAISILYKIIYLIRRENLDIFAILFESPRLILLSKFSGAKYVFTYSIHAEYKPVTQRLYKVFTNLLKKRIKGFIFYIYLYIYIHIFTKTHRD